MMEARALRSISEFEDAVRLQQEIWGFEDIELLPKRLFVVANKVGGQTFGVYDGDRMVCFLIAIPGIKKDGMPYIHSHMLGTSAGYRDKGLGRQLKLMQRDDAIARGIKLVEWTFDPLEIKNAYFNIERLGCVVRRYILNNYGATSSHLHGGLPTDRCVAEWWLGSERVLGVLERKPRPRPAEEARISIPNNIDELKKSDPKQAREIQKSASERFLECFDRGLSVVGFERMPDSGDYLLGAFPEGSEPWR